MMYCDEAQRCDVSAESGPAIDLAQWGGCVCVCVARWTQWGRDRSLLGSGPTANCFGGKDPQKTVKLLQFITAS